MRTSLVLSTLAILATSIVSAQEKTVTYATDVAPIFFKNCAMCHRPGEVAPMSLLTYKEARPWAKSIAKAVATKQMPPFSGESENHQWKNDISLTDEEIETIVAWVEQGAKQGNPKDMPDTPEFNNGWKLGEPDHIISLQKVEVPAEGEDLFLKEVINLKLPESKWVKAIEFMPGDRRATHHFQATYTSQGGPTKQAGSIGGILAIWTAGMPPFEFPEGVGRPMGTSNRILVDSHHHPFGEATTDETKIGLYYGEGDIQKEVSTIAATNTGIRIPPGASAHEEYCFNIFDRDMQILAFSPHMHVRGKAMRYDLVLPDGTRETLLDVPKYNYNWQWQYYPTEPIDAPAGSKVEVFGVFDNSAENEFNPDPTKEIRYRGDTFNEMFVGFLEVIPKNETFHIAKSAKERLTELLSAHPAEDSYIVNGFLPFGFYAPKEGKGYMYLVNGINMFTIDVDEIEWKGDDLKITVQMPTQEASATLSTFEGTLEANGKIKGKFNYGLDAAQTLKMPSTAIPVAGD